MTSTMAELPVPAGAGVAGAASPDRTDLGRTDIDHSAIDHETTEFGRASMLVWRPLLEAESSR